MPPAAPRSLLRRIRWRNVATAAALLLTVGLAVVWTTTGPAEAPLPPAVAPAGVAPPLVRPAQTVALPPAQAGGSEGKAVERRPRRHHRARRRAHADRTDPPPVTPGPRAGSASPPEFALD